MPEMGIRGSCDCEVVPVLVGLGFPTIAGDLLSTARKPGAHTSDPFK